MVLHFFGFFEFTSLCIEASWSCWECLERLILAVALQLVAVAYGVNSFSKPPEDLEDCMVKLLECLRNPRYRLGIIRGCSWFVVDGAPLLQSDDGDSLMDLCRTDRR
eukprot:Gb_07609 [translate_table: standard]